MKKIEIELEAVTAVFMHIEPEGEARWRAAPFRGLTRYWYRALLGCSLPPDEVRRSEADLFGTSSESSRVILRVFGEAKTNSYPVNPGSSRGASRSAISPESRVRIELATAMHGSEEHLLKAYAAFWAAIHLGGIGQRARRGAGSLRIRKVDAPEGLPGAMVANTADGYAIALRTGLNQVRRSLGVEHDRDLGGDCAEYPILHPRSAVVCVAHANWSGKEDEIRKGLMNLRRQLHRNPDHRSEYEFGDIQPRLSSPLWVRIAGAMAPGTLVTATLLRHQGAVKSAVKSGSVNWENAERFIRSIGQRQENVFGSFTHA